MCCPLMKDDRTTLLFVRNERRIKNKIKINPLAPGKNTGSLPARHFTSSVLSFKSCGTILFSGEIIFYDRL